VYDSGEDPLPDVRVFVDVNTNGTWDVGEPYDLTATNGLYSIGGLPDGTFIVKVDTTTLPAGLRQTADPDATFDDQTEVTLTPGQVVTTANFGYTFPGVISGSVFVDRDGDGVADAVDTNGISGVTIELLTNGVVAATTTTTATGGYSFTNLLPGSYVVREVDLSGWYSTLDTDAPITNNLIAVTLTSGQTSTGNDFYDTQYARIGDFVWNDLDGDGVQDAGESGLTNITVRLLDATSNVLFTAITDTNGVYSFTNLLPATYLVQVVAPTQYVFTVQDTTATNDLADSDVDASGLTGPFVLESGTTDLSIDAGMYVGARIYGHVYLDINTNLVRTLRVDYPLAATTVTLWRAGVQIASTLTSADGSGYYEFKYLQAGDYVVRFSGDTNLLEAVASSGSAATDPERNRAALDGDGKIAIAVTVDPGEGVLTATEPQNAGFLKAEGPMSLSVSLRTYSTANGVKVEVTTSGEMDFGLISVWVWMGNRWVDVGIAPAVGFGSNTYSFDAPNLVVGERYYFQVEDEVGFLYDLYGVEVTPFAMQMQLMERTGVRLTWTSVPYRWYGIYTTPVLGRMWTLLEMVWAEEETSTLDVRIDPDEPQRFFKIEMFRDAVIEEGGAQ